MANDKRDVKFLSPGLKSSLLSHFATLQQSIVEGVFKPFSASFDDVIQSSCKVCHDSAWISFMIVSYTSSFTKFFNNPSNATLCRHLSVGKRTRKRSLHQQGRFCGQIFLKYQSPLTNAEIIFRIHDWWHIKIWTFLMTSVEKKWRNSNFYVFFSVLKCVLIFWDTLYTF